LIWQLPVDALAFLGTDLEPVLEPGRFDIHVGQSADPRDLLSGSIDVLP
jgi:hypothetical protein